MPTIDPNASILDASERAKVSQRELDEAIKVFSPLLSLSFFP